MAFTVGQKWSPQKFSGNYNSLCKLSDNSYEELKWWVENLPNCFNPIKKFFPKSVVYSDACPNGWELPLKISQLGDYGPQKRQNYT